MTASTDDHTVRPAIRVIQLTVVLAVLALAVFVTFLITNQSTPTPPPTAFQTLQADINAGFEQAHDQLPGCTQSQDPDSVPCQQLVATEIRLQAQVDQLMNTINRQPGLQPTDLSVTDHQRFSFYNGTTVVPLFRKYPRVADLVAYLG